MNIWRATGCRPLSETKPPPKRGRAEPCHKTMAGSSTRIPNMPLGVWWCWQGCHSTFQHREGRKSSKPPPALSFGGKIKSPQRQGGAVHVQLLTFYIVYKPLAVETESNYRIYSCISRPV
uniref:Uncharacterized protein n=1 Tax=Sphaerodactylus townsendi TaxID=933632 RepID=A0ACB8EGF2_9SAUR